MNAACPVLLSAGILLFYMVQMRHLLKTQRDVDALDSQLSASRLSSQCVVIKDEADRAAATPLVRRALGHPDGVATDTLNGSRQIALCDATRGICCTLP